MRQFPCACPPFSRPVGPLIAKPAAWPRYTIPCSNLLDPAFARQLNPGFPFPRFPRPFESETRADGTGLIWGGATINPCPPCPPPQPCPPWPCPPVVQPCPPTGPVPFRATVPVTAVRIV